MIVPVGGGPLDLQQLPTADLVRACTQQGMIARGTREEMITQLTGKSVGGQILYSNDGGLMSFCCSDR